VQYLGSSLDQSNRPTTGVATGTVINNGGQQVVDAGGKAINTTINNGGVQIIEQLSGAASSIASGSTINAGGVQYISAGCNASGTNDGGVEYALAGGTAIRTTIESGGALYVSSNGGADGTTIDSGGAMYVSSGGAVGGFIGNGQFNVTTTINGGFVELQSGAVTSGDTVSFTNAGGTLQLDASQSFQGLIAGFASPPHVFEGIDFEDISSGKHDKVSFKEAANKTSGTLTVTDGTHTATLTLLGVYSTGMFSLASDGHGGVMITDPPLQAGNPQLVTPHA
jgi:autotransporter passenger strand-loop-strand repeat protein